MPVFCCSRQNASVVCSHRGRYVDEAECKCGGVYECNLLGKLCTAQQPIDEFVHIQNTSTRLTADNHQVCATCDKFIAAPLPTGNVGPMQTNHRPVIGFVLAAFCKIGGVETWARALLPKLAERYRLAGIVATHAYDGDQLECCRVSFGAHLVGPLSIECDVLVVWGVENVFQWIWDRQVKTIGVHHGDCSSDWSMRTVSQQFDRVVAINSDVATEHSFTCIPNAVTDDRIEVTLRLPKTRPVAVWCARLSEEKRPDLAVRAAELMPDWDWYFVGGDGVPASPNIHYVGKQPSQANWLAIADVFVSSAASEGFGLSMGEAMLAGVPVVATPFGLGVHGELVFQLPATPTPEEIAGAVRAANRSKVEVARRFIVEHHSLEAVAAQWCELIDGLLEPVV